MNLDLLTSDLIDEEGWRSVIYDDATGKPITKGTLVQGVPTVGAGLTGPFTRDELMPITRSRAATAWGTLLAAEPWMGTITEPRQRALTDMAYNLGVTGLLKFATFLSLMKSGQYDAAADDLANTAWWKQIGQRGPKIQALIKGAEE